MRKRLRAALILVAGLAITLGGLLAPAAVAQTGIVPGPGYVQISTPGPLSQIDVGADTTMQVVDSRASGAGEFHYPQTSCTADLGVYVTVGATVYGPNPMAPWHCAASNLNPPGAVYTPVSQVATGNGSSASPYTVVTTVRLTPAITLTQTITYVTGQAVIGETNRLASSGGAFTAKIFDAAEPGPGGNATAYGNLFPTGAVGAFDPVDPSTGTVRSCSSPLPPSPYYFVAFSPVTPWQRFVVDQYATVFGQVSASRTGSGLSDSINGGCITPGVAVEWDVTVPAGSSVSVAKSIVLGSTLPPLHPGTIIAHINCSSAVNPNVTCSRVPPPNLCGSCSRSFNTLTQVSCAGVPLTSLLNLACSGAITGTIGLSAYVMSVKSGGIALGPGNVQTMTLTGAGMYANVGATFQVTATDNETTGVDTVQLTVHGVLGPVTMQWTCRNVAGCLEVAPTG